MFARSFILSILAALAAGCATGPASSEHAAAIEESSPAGQRWSSTYVDDADGIPRTFTASIELTQSSQFVVWRLDRGTGERQPLLDHPYADAPSGAAVTNPDTGETATLSTDGAALLFDAPGESAQLDASFVGPAAACVTETTTTDTTEIGRTPTSPSQTSFVERTQCLQIPNPFLCELCCTACIATHRRLGVPRWLDPLCCRYLAGCRCTS
jgi:hypothetical protein